MQETAMIDKSTVPFDSIESAHDFVSLLSEVVNQAKKEIEADVKREIGSNVPRRLDAFRLALYSLERLEGHMVRSCRILNDLRSLRRLLFEERTNGAARVAAKPAPKVELPAKPVPAVPLPPVAPAGSRAGTTIAA
jgi:hypothetical protein